MDLTCWPPFQGVFWLDLYPLSGKPALFDSDLEQCEEKEKILGSDAKTPTPPWLAGSNWLWKQGAPSTSPVSHLSPRLVHLAGAASKVCLCFVAVTTAIL